MHNRNFFHLAWMLTLFLMPSSALAQEAAHDGDDEVKATIDDAAETEARPEAEPAGGAPDEVDGVAAQHAEPPGDVADELSEDRSEGWQDVFAPDALRRHIRLKKRLVGIVVVDEHNTGTWGADNAVVQLRAALEADQNTVEVLPAPRATHDDKTLLQHLRDDHEFEALFVVRTTTSEALRIGIWSRKGRRLTTVTARQGEALASTRDVSPSSTAKKTSRAERKRRMFRDKPTGLRARLKRREAIRVTRPDVAGGGGFFRSRANFYSPTGSPMNQEEVLQHIGRKDLLEELQSRQHLSVVMYGLGLGSIALAPMVSLLAMPLFFISPLLAMPAYAAVNVVGITAGLAFVGVGLYQAFAPHHDEEIEQAVHEYNRGGRRRPSLEATWME